MKTQEFLGVPVSLTVPGDVLRRELDARGLSQRAFAELTGRPEQVVSEIIRGKKRITAETALDFARALGIEAEFWLGLQVNYELDHARNRQSSQRASRAKVVGRRGSVRGERATPTTKRLSRRQAKA
ncbi:MAG TPA: HigA family addiction module antitoxin [Polyangiaceae bacterium]|nr:HigA family addiction module antitoxin [Polyangiaceae bacterium]